MVSFEPLFTENVLEAPLDEVVCYCVGVTKGQILGAIREGARGLQDIQAMTHACTLGQCEELSPRRR